MSGPRSVLVVGSGAAAGLAALALHRAFAPTGMSLRWIETPDDGDRHAAFAARATLDAFHARIGIDRATLLARTDATLAFGHDLVGWGGTPWLAAPGTVGRPIAALPFTGFWAKARAGGMPAAFADFSITAAAVRHGRVAADGAEPGAHLDAAGYATLLRAAVATTGVRIDRVAEPRRLVGETVAADLYVDATADGSLIAAVDRAAAVRRGPAAIDRIATASIAPVTPPPLHGRIIAHPAGWATLTPLRSRTAVRIGWSSALASAGDLARLTGLPVTDLHERPLDATARAAPWTGNVVAIGSVAAHAIDMALHEVQVAVAHLVSLFPRADDMAVEARLYNHEIAAFRARIDDMMALHHRRNARTGEPLWDALRVADVSPELDAKLGLFAARGMIVQHHQESFDEDEWATAMTGHGIVPRSWDPGVDRVPDGEVMETLRALLGEVRRAVGAAPDHATALAAAMAR